MRRLTFEEMAFSRASDAWCPVTGRTVGPNTPRVVTDKIIKHISDIPIYHRFDASQGFVKYSNEIGCFTRLAEETHVYTDELDALETRITAALPTFVRDDYWTGSEDGRSLEYIASRAITASDEVFLVDTMIHGNECDGVLGTLKAFEVLCTNPYFASLREQFVIAFLPCCNPDGYYLGTRDVNKLGPHPSGIDQTINLNRVWPWFWTEFIPTANESKGDNPITCTEESLGMQAFLDQLSGGNPIKVAWSLDQHSTIGDGARYVSRDRNFRDLSEEDYEKVWADWNTYRLLKSIQAKRVQEDAQPDLWINFFRSRWRPHWHSYLGTRSLDSNGGIQAVSLVGEHNKVSLQNTLTVKESYQSASNYNFDHIISMALIAQGGVTERKTAVLVEHETGTNLAQNSEFAVWQPDEYRPSYWHNNRTIIEESDRSEQHMHTTGKPQRMTTDVLIEMPTGHTDAFWGNDIVYLNGTTTSAILSARIDDGITTDTLAVYSWNFEIDPVLLFNDVTPALANHQWRLGQCTSTLVSLLGLGNYSTSDNVLFRAYDYVVDTWVPTDKVTHTSPLVDAAVSYDNNGNIYIIGGRISAGSSSAKIYKADCSAWTFAEVGTNLLTSGDYGMGSCWCTSGALSNIVVIVGGTDVGSSGLVVRIFDPNGPSVDSYTVTMPSGCSSSLTYSGVWYDEVDSVYIYGGSELSSGNVFYNIIKLTWDGSDFSAEEIVLDAGLTGDGDPEDYSGTEDWILPFKSWRALRIVEPDTLVPSIALFGGLERLSDGTDETDLDNRRGFWLHYIDDGVIAQSSDYDYGYTRYSTHFDVVGYTKAVSSASCKVDPNLSSEATASYARLVNSTGDSSTGLISLRSVRTYYLHPPKWWWREHTSIDTSMAKPSVVEDEIRTYIRGYRQGQTILADSHMFQTDTLWPSSWSPYGTTRAIEEASWSNVVDNRWYRISFDWLPGAAFMNLSNAEQKLLTIGDVTNTQYLEITAKCTEDRNRMYFRDGVVGPVDPYIELKVIDGITTPTTLSIPLYWGGYVKDACMGRFESPVQIEVWRHAQYGTGLIVKNAWTKGWVKDSTRFDHTAWSSTCNVVIHGGGWWGEPELLNFNAEWKKIYKSADNSNGALLVGDRDPCYGQVIRTNCFDYIEEFTRADNTNLGDYWDVIKQIGNGWDIRSNKARCEQTGIEKWDACPYIRDCAVIADISTPNGGKVGLCTRLHWGMGVSGFSHGYVGYLQCTGATTGNLVIERHYWDTGTQASSVLATQAVTYAAGTTVTLTLEAIETDITLTMSGSSTGTVTVSDSNHILPGAFGIYGVSSGTGNYVYLDNISAEVRNGIKLRITE